MFTENRAETSELEKLIFLICFIFLKNVKINKVGESYVHFFVIFLL